MKSWRNQKTKNGDPIPPACTYSEFRVTFIPADYPAMANKKLEPLIPQPTTSILPPPPPTGR